MNLGYNKKEAIKRLFDYIMKDEVKIIEISRELDTQDYIAKGGLASGSYTGYSDIQIRIFDEETHIKGVEKMARESQ